MIGKGEGIRRGIRRRYRRGRLCIACGIARAVGGINPEIIRCAIVQSRYRGGCGICCRGGKERPVAARRGFIVNLEAGFIAGVVRPAKRHLTVTRRGGVQGGGIGNRHHICYGDADDFYGSVLHNNGDSLGRAGGNDIRIGNSGCRFFDCGGIHLQSSTGQGKLTRVDKGHAIAGNAGDDARRHGDANVAGIFIHTCSSRQGGFIHGDDPGGGLIHSGKNSRRTDSRIARHFPEERSCRPLLQRLALLFFRGRLFTRDAFAGWAETPFQTQARCPVIAVFVGQALLVVICPRIAAFEVNGNVINNFPVDLQFGADFFTGAGGGGKFQAEAFRNILKEGSLE